MAFILIYEVESFQTVQFLIGLWIVKLLVIFIVLILEKLLNFGKTFNFEKPFDLKKKFDFGKNLNFGNANVFFFFLLPRTVNIKNYQTYEKYS